MLIMEHPYIRYAQALLLKENNLTNVLEITEEHIRREIAKGLDCFSVKPAGSYEGKDTVVYSFVGEKNNAKDFTFLSPHVISTEMKASNIYKAADKIKEVQSLNLSASCKISQSGMPTTGEFNAFSENGNISRGKPSSTVYKECLAIITSLTRVKPCLQNANENVCIIPDLEIGALVDFIELFKRISLSNSASNLMIGKVVKSEQGRKGKVTFLPKRPKIFRGNFPNPPQTSALGSIALLGTLGEMVQESEVSDLATKVVESLKDANIYMVKYGDASVFTYNHYIVDLAKRGSLRKVVDSIYRCTLYSQGERVRANGTEYEKFDLFASRFLQLFNQSAFKDFFAFRAEYPLMIELLLTTYFEKMEKIDARIVASAKELGRWLNSVAYCAALKEFEEETPSKEGIRKAKAKILVELESSVFSSKTGDALIAQTTVRAGRLSGTDAPSAATLFMEKTVTGELELEKAKNLLVAFSRLKSESGKGKDNPTEQHLSEEEYDMEQDFMDI